MKSSKQNQIGDNIRALQLLQILETIAGNLLDTENPEFTGKLIPGISPRYCLLCTYQRWTCMLIASALKVSYKLTFRKLKNLPGFSNLEFKSSHPLCYKKV